MNLATEADFKHLLPCTLISDFYHLDESLKSIFVTRLLPTKEKISHNIAITALKVIAIEHPSQDLSLKNQKKRFFVNLLAEVTPQVQEALSKIHTVAQNGLFHEFLNKIRSYKRSYHSHKEIIKLINDFHSESLPNLNKSNQVRELLTSEICINAYDAIISCRKFYEMPKLAKEFITLLPSSQRWNFDNYEHFFNLLNFEFNNKFSESLKIELTRGIFLLHSPSRIAPLCQSTKVDLTEYVHLCHQLSYYYGEEFLLTCLHSMNNNEAVLNERITVFGELSIYLDDYCFLDFYENWSIHNYDWEYLRGVLQATKDSDHSIEDDVQTRIDRFKNDPSIIQSLSDSELCSLAIRYQTVNQYCDEHKNLKFNQLINIAHKIREKAKHQKINDSDRLLLIALGRLVIHHHFGIYPYSTQIMALLGLLQEGKNRQAQVKTGEGKSVIVALWGFVMAMESRAADIITSSRYLAIRDYEKYKDFFKRCGVVSGHICHDSKMPTHFECQILYGPAFDFEFAWMEDLLYGKNLYAQRLKNKHVRRNFDAVCVDESDNLLIDTARNGARLGTPSENSFEWIYSPILSYVRLNVDVVKSLKSESIQNLREYLLSNLQLVNHHVIKQIPDSQLSTWLTSAYHALFELSEETDYIIKSKRDENGGIKKCVQIVDLQTGRISENSRWSNGIHEFLEVKHDIIVERESITPISLSHAVFYQFYSTITALTGTAERFQTKEIYQIESFDVPPHLAQIREDHPPSIAENTAVYYEMILKEIQTCKLTYRPCLILCATIKESKKLAARLKQEQLTCQLLNEVQEELEHVVLSRAGAPGSITIATNTAGRGTDIILSPESIKNGGLHVVVSFYSDSRRVEEQAIGRAGRQGQPGSSKIILNREDPKIKSVFKERGTPTSDAEALKILCNQRILREKYQARMHLLFADLERFLAEKTELFFRNFRDWTDLIDQDPFLDTFARKLSKIRLKPDRKFDYSKLAEADAKIAVELHSLLTKKSEIINWKILLKQAVNRLKEKIINDWVNFFYDSANEELKTTAYTIDKERIVLESFLEEATKYFSGHDDLLGGAKLIQNRLSQLDQLMRSTKTKIDMKFSIFQGQFNKYLELDGSGLTHYLSDVLSLNIYSIVFRGKNS